MFNCVLLSGKITTNARRGHFFVAAVPTPRSSYSALLVESSAKLEWAARIEPPTQTAGLAKGGDTFKCSPKLDGSSAASSRCMRSGRPGNLVLSPASTMLPASAWVESGKGGVLVCHGNRTSLIVKNLKLCLFVSFSLLLFLFPSF